MVRVFFLYSSMMAVLMAKTLSVDYIVEFGIVGQVAKIHTSYYDNGKNYTIDSNVSAVGMLANSVTQHMRERHICKGYIAKDKRLIAKSYQMIKSFDSYRSMTLYTVDHTHKKILKTYKKWQKQKGKPDKKTHDYHYPLHYYAKDDMITLFLNLGTHIKNKNKAKSYTFKAVGADRKNGRVDIKIPSSKASKGMYKLLGKPKKGEWLMNLVMHRRLYNSKNGELMVKMGKDSTIEKAVLKDLLFWGDVRIIRR